MTAFALYRLPGHHEATLIQGQEQPLEAGKQLPESFILQPFDRKEAGVAIRQDETKRFLPEDATLPDAANLQNKKNCEGKAADEAGYTALVGKALRELEGNSFQKVVASRRLAVKIPSRFDPLKLWQQLCQAYPEAFVYLCATEQFGLWIGASPELLLHRKGTDIQTVALAGTLRNHVDSFSEKEKREQELVTDYIREKLKPFAEELFITEPGLQHAGKLTHLLSRIEAKLKPEADWQKALRALHPTPAVCGVPEEAALQFIQENEGYPRELYSGFLGPVSEDEAHLFVNLRCAQITEEGACLYAGAGIVEGSDPHQEWLETEAKMETLRRFLTSPRDAGNQPGHHPPLPDAPIGR